IEATADFNGDGNPDLVWKNTTTGARTIWLMIGAYWYTYVNLPNLGTGVDVLGAGDFNHDGKPDLVLRYQGTGVVRIRFMDGTSWGATDAPVPNVPQSATLAGVADFDGDGNPDLAWNYPGDPAQHYVWFMDGTTVKSQQPLPDSPYYWRISAVGDVNGDGKPDLVWTHTVSGERVIWMMNGTQWTGAYATLPTVPLEWQIVGVMPIPITQPLPSATIDGAHQDTTDVVFSATVNGNGLPGSYWFEYRPSGSNVDFTPTQPGTLEPGTAPRSVSSTGHDFFAIGNYDYRVVVTNAAGTTRSEQRTIFVGKVEPNMQDLPPVFISQNTAELRGVVDPHDNTVEVYFEVSSSPYFTGGSSNRRTLNGHTPILVTEQVGISAGSTLYYRLVLLSYAGNFRGPTRTLTAAPPAAPVNVTAAGGYNLAVQWQDGAANPPVNSYDVLRNGGHVALVMTNSLTDGTIPVDSARSWTYQVKACNPFGCSPASAPAQVTNTPLAAPSNLVATPIGGGKVQLTWQDNSVGEIWFTVQQKTTGSSTWNTVVTTAPNATSYTVASGLVPGQTYEFRVFAAVSAYSSAIPVNGVRNSAPAQTSALVN
ncbi:MAG: FG-GAP repeat protein, partial [Gemmatimonadetes bacterium]|nr:FG-GAP repeat protein [Gemmatimonadota bacterium]